MLEGYIVAYHILATVKSHYEHTRPVAKTGTQPHLNKNSIRTHCWNTFLPQNKKPLSAANAACWKIYAVQLTKLEASDEDLALLKNSLLQLDELFLLVVVGEFNAGKSAFVNAMLGDNILTEGVTPTTSQIHILRHGDTHQQSPANNGFYDDDLLIVQMPVRVAACD